MKLAKVYFPQGDKLPEEREMLCAVMSGSRFEHGWYGGSEVMDFFDAKGIIENLCQYLGLSPVFTSGSDAGLHPISQLAVTVDGEKVGGLGELHPNIKEAFEIEGSAFIIEIDVAHLMAHAGADRMYRPVNRFPANIRDIALVLDNENYPPAGSEYHRKLFTGNPLSAFRHLYRGQDCWRQKIAGVPFKLPVCRAHPDGR